MSSAEPVTGQDSAASANEHSENHRLVSARQRAIDLAIHRHIDGKIYPQQPTKLEQRLQRRLLQEQLQRQDNLEKIMQIAASLCHDTLAKESDPDWVSSFLQLAQEARGAPMQRLWGRILAQEIVTPGSFSIKALRTLRDMTQREALLFQRACSVACSFGADLSAKRIITGIRPGKSGLKSLFRTPAPEQLNLGSFKLPFSALLLLQELGLLLGGELESGSLLPEQNYSLRFASTDLTLTTFDTAHRLTYYRFSPVGEELSQLLIDTSLPEYIQCISNLLSAYLTVTPRSSSVSV